MGNGQAPRRQDEIRPHVGYVTAMVLFAAVFATLVLSAFHAPKPHGLPVGIVAPALVTKQVEGALDKAVPGGFDPRVYPTEDAARAGLARGTLDGALIDRNGRPRLLLALAQGTAPAQTLTAAFEQLDARSGQTLVITDVVPPLPGDSLALSSFFVILSVLFPSMAAGSASALVFRHSSAAWCVGAPVVAAVAIGAVAAAIVDGMAGFGRYPVITGLVTLFALAVALPTAALGRIRPPLMALALLVLVMVSIPVSGGPSGLASYTPAYLRVLHPALPLGVAAGAVRSVVYFGGHGSTGPVSVLAAWAGCGLAALTAVTLRRSAQARHLAPAPATAAGAEVEGDGRHLVGTVAATGFVVGFDDSAPARRALGEAARLAAARHEILHVVYADHVIIGSDLAGFAYAEMEETRKDAAKKVAEAAAEISDEAGVACTFERSRTAPAEAILSAASTLAHGDQTTILIVVGRSGHGARHLLGSVPTHLLAHSSYPVLVIP